MDRALLQGAGWMGLGDDDLELDLRDGPDDAVRAGLAGYRLPAVLSWRHGSGPGRHVAVTDEGEYQLCVATTPAGSAAARFDAHLRDHLAGRDQPVVPVVRTREGSLYQEGRPALVVYGPDRRVGGFDPSDRRDLFLAGKALFGFHRAVGDFGLRLRRWARPPLPVLEHRGPSLLAYFSGVASPHLCRQRRSDLTRAGSFLWSQFIRVPEALVRAGPDLARTVTHGRFTTRSVRFSGGRCVSIDGFSAAYDARACDVAAAVDLLARQGAAIDLERVASLVSGYGPSLTVAELAALPWMLRMRALVEVFMATAPIAAGQRLGDYDPTVSLLERRAAHLAWLEERCDDLIAASCASVRS